MLRDDLSGLTIYKAVLFAANLGPNLATFCPWNLLESLSQVQLTAATSTLPVSTYIYNRVYIRTNDQTLLTLLWNSPISVVVLFVSSRYGESAFRSMEYA